MCAVLSGLLLGSSAMTAVPATTYAASNDKQVTIYLTRHGETTGNVMQRARSYCATSIEVFCQSKYKDYDNTNVT